MTGSPDPEQQLVIDAPADARLVVSAPPGSGKTWTAAERLGRLAQEHSDDERGLLALSFSRAAAFALTSQLHRAGVGARVEVRTIDSWATRILMWFGTDGFEGRGHDHTIASAAALLERAVTELEYRHVVVDEAQDVHGIRSVLVEGLLTSDAVGGWTVLGDAAQAIFEFDAAGSEHLLRKMSARDGILRLQLRGCHRAQSETAAEVVALGEALRSDTADTSGLRAVWHRYRGLRGLKLDSFLTAAPTYSVDSRATSVLVRDNRRVLELSELLADRGVDHRITAARDEGVVPSWVAGLSGDHRRWMTSDEIESVVPDGIDVGPVVRTVRSLCRSTADRVLTDDLGDRFMAAGVPEAFLQDVGAGLTLSTIHRAKGLEYDKVFVSMAGASGDRTDEQDDDEARVLYVALTRARSELLRLDHVTALHSRRDVRTRRWTDVKFRGKHHHAVAIEMRPADLNPLCPWRDVASRLEQVDGVATGSAVRLLPSGEGPTGLPMHTVVVGDGTVLGTTTPDLGETLQRVGWDSAVLGGARVVGRSTIALPAGAALSGRRLAAVPVVRGMISDIGGD